MTQRLSQRGQVISQRTKDVMRYIRTRRIRGSALYQRKVLSAAKSIELAYPIYTSHLKSRNFATINHQSALLTAVMQLR